MIYIELLTVAAVTVYIVGVSGFTESWRAALARLLHIPDADLMRDIKPFDCPRCMTFWCCIIWALVRHDFSLWTAATAAALSLLSLPMQQLLLFIREGLAALIGKITPQK